MSYSNEKFNFLAISDHTYVFDHHAIKKKKVSTLNLPHISNFAFFYKSKSRHNFGRVKLRFTQTFDLLL